MVQYKEEKEKERKEKERKEKEKHSTRAGLKAGYPVPSDKLKVRTVR